MTAEPITDAVGTAFTGATLPLHLPARSAAALTHATPDVATFDELVAGTQSASGQQDASDRPLRHPYWRSRTGSIRHAKESGTFRPETMRLGPAREAMKTAGRTSGTQIDLSGISLSKGVSTVQDPDTALPLPSDATRPLRPQQRPRPRIRTALGRKAAAERTQGEPGTRARGDGWNGHDRRSADRIKRLSREFDALCTSAVDAAEIAAGLESVGFTDSTAREYGFRDVFALAESLFQQTPRIVNRKPGRLANPWAERPLRHLSRGATFALPGLVFVACLPRVTLTIDFLALTVALLFGWPIGQVMSLLGYTLEGRRHPMAARAILISGLAAALLLSVIYAGIALWCGASPPVAALGAGEITYMAAASAVLVMDYEWAVLGSLAPGLVAAALGWRGIASSRGIAVGALATATFIVVAAVVACRGARPAHLRTVMDELSHGDWREVGFHTFYGISGGILVTLPALTNKNSAAGSLSLLPVIWSMGFAEWHIVSLRRQSFALLNEAISVEFFRFSVWQLAKKSVLRYLTILTLLTAGLLAAVGIATAQPPSTTALVSYLASWLLGWGFYLALVLSSLGQMRIVVSVMAISVALGLTVNSVLPWQPLILVTPLILALLLITPIRQTIGDPTRHM